jgi:hypothetical protein
MDWQAILIIGGIVIGIFILAILAKRYVFDEPMSNIKDVYLSASDKEREALHEMGGRALEKFAPNLHYILTGKQPPSTPPNTQNPATPPRPTSPPSRPEPPKKRSGLYVGDDDE